VSRGDIEKARIAHERQERERRIKEAQKDSNDYMDRVTMFKELLTIMKRGETLLDALKRLGSNAGSKTNNKRGPKQYGKKQKDENPKSPLPEERELTHEEKLEQNRVKSIERLTDLSVMATGYVDIYEDTWEQILRNLKREGAVPEDWMPPGTDEDVPNENPPESQDKLDVTISLPSFTQWEYRWMDKSGNAGEIYGPFSGEDMKAW
ncbi:3422_t:CDS:1, partial [Acaulospora colombiana]